MPVESPLLPQRGLPVLEARGAPSSVGPNGQASGGDGTFSLPWYRWFQGLASSVDGGLTPDEVDALIATAVAPIIETANEALATANEALTAAGGYNVLTLLGIADLDR